MHVCSSHPCQRWQITTWRRSQLLSLPPSLSISLFSFAYVRLFLFFLPLTFSFDLSSSCTPVLSHKSHWLFLCVFVCQGQKKIVENRLWRNVCLSSGPKKKKQNRQSSNSFDLLSPLFLMVPVPGYQSLLSDPVTKLLNFTHLHYMSTDKVEKKCLWTLCDFLSVHQWSKQGEKSIC